MTSIRRVGPDDSQFIGAMAEQAGLFPADALPDMIAPYFAGEGDQHWLVAWDGSTVIGFCYCAPERFTDGTYNLLAIATDDRRRGTGNGKALVAAVEAELLSAGGRLLLVETSSQPQFEATQRFYRAAGFEHVATIPDYWAAGDAKVIFSKPVGD